MSAAAEAVARASYGKLVAFLAARTYDVAGAEDALSEAFLAALAEWPVSGVPRTPDAWLMTVAKRKLVDAARRRQTAEHAVPEVMRQVMDAAESEHEIPDERLRLMFACAHPALDAAIRAPLMLQTVLGFDAARIGSAFLVAPATMGQRLVRAKTRIRQAGIPFSIPEQAELPERLDAVLEAIYAVYSEGWADPVGAEAGTRGLAEEAVYLGRVVAALLPEEPEALGLLALMLHAEARRAARRDAEGEFVPLAEQDCRLWNDQLIGEAEQLLWTASKAGRPGRFQWEAAVQSAHAARRITGVTDWASIVQIYDALVATTGSIVAVINRAVAVAMAGRLTEGIETLRAMGGDGRLVEYQPYWAGLAALLAEAGDVAGAAEAYQRAIGLQTDPALRRYLQRQLAGLR